MHVQGRYTSTMPWDSSEFPASAHFYFMSDDYEWLLEFDDELGIFSPATRAAITPDRVNVDLVIDNIAFSYAEYDQIEPHVGDTFSHHFYGKRPVVFSVSGTLVDMQHSFGKSVLMELYRWVFRISRVAKTGMAPCLIFNGCLVQGAMLGMNIRETGGMQDILQVQFQYFVFEMYHENLQDVNLASSRGGIII